MTVLFVVLPLAVGLSGLAVLAFVWATKSGQLDDLETPAVRVLCDDVKASTREPAPESASPPAP
jgi:cbb3-type cytochrome oxidase maturation protein